ncbi:MAG: thioredoxin domain-containing protein [Nitrospiraceae bacterium]
MAGTSGTGKANRLQHETSPYLLQHARNPVDWYPWGPEALAEALRLRRPILLSIGYSSCHWCHVMERESFENEAIAALMNEHFICIKVDREERPDLDEIYMQATLALNHNQGGWPMTVFLTPNQQPFFAGTYFPPEDRWGRPGFPTVLKKIAEYWAQDPQGLVNQAATLTARLKEGAHAPSPTMVGEAELDTAVTQFAEDFDPKHGGFSGAPKFPPATGLSLLLRCYARSGDSHTLHMVRKTLDEMAAGGMYDHIGGGFARYSTDDRWLVPHFEKMLYDNALLAHVYVEAYQVTGDSTYHRIATETLDYVLREMTAPDGGFYSSTDADSEGVEGKFFVWTPDSIRAAVSTDDDARLLCTYYDVTPGGNWEHTNVLHTPRSQEEVAKELGLTVADLSERLDRLKPLLYAARSKRIPPDLDDKVITAWNGMMIRAMAEAGRVFGEKRYVEAAQRAADFLLAHHSKQDGRLLRTSRGGKAHLDAYLEDYAYLAESLVDLYETQGATGTCERQFVSQSAYWKTFMIVNTAHFSPPPPATNTSSSEAARARWRDAQWQFGRGLCLCAPLRAWCPRGFSTSGHRRDSCVWPTDRPVPARVCKKSGRRRFSHAGPDRIGFRRVAHRPGNDLIERRSGSAFPPESHLCLRRPGHPD